MHATSIYIAREQFIRHQTVKRTQARSEYFHICVVRALLHMRVFVKFKSSCTVLLSYDGTMAFKKLDGIRNRYCGITTKPVYCSALDIATYIHICKQGCFKVITTLYYTTL